MRGRIRHPGVALLAIGLVAALAGLGPPPAGAQAPVHESGVGSAPDVPAGEGTLRVRLVDPEQPSSVAGAEVILYSLAPDGQPGLRRAEADEQGRFTFEGISTSPGVVYLVGTRIGGVPFGSRTAFSEGERARVVVVEVSTPSADTAAVSPGRAEIRVERGCSDLRLHHVHQLDLGGVERVLRVPPDAREGATPLLELELPEGASEIETPLGANAGSFERDGRRLRFWGPVYPGDPQVEFGYAVPQDRAADLALGFPRGSGEVLLLAPEEGVGVASGDLREVPPPAPDGGALRALRADPLEPGASLRFALSARDLPRDERVRVSEARIWIELDDAAMQVNEVHLLEVADGAELSASAQGPLLCLPLPDGAQDLRLSNAALELGLSRDPSGAIAVGGPLPPGESSVALRYRLPALTEPALFERTFSRRVPLLSLLVADTGLVPHTQRLHNRRPVRTEDQAYLHLEGFGIEAGEPVRVAFERISLAGGLPPLLSGGFVFLAACVALFFLIDPLRRPGAEEVPEAAPERSTEREAVYHAIGALDEDFETGKLSAEDHARMRDALRGKAVALLQEEREAEARAERAARTEAADEGAPGPGRFCTACGARSRTGDRFCAHCGTPLAGQEPAAS